MTALKVGLLICRSDRSGEYAEGVVLVIELLTRKLGFIFFSVTIEIMTIADVAGVTGRVQGPPHAV